ncbi:DUF488 domain-containing protein [Cellulosimicrobium sp. PMB13]|uniref:DUF488 domain-containing protein n=1 Tax=Cellulosimicrobium sp. PMB13 TaxID=3120158 RepID=UPI003F4BB45D
MDELVSDARLGAVVAVVDVRLNPISRKRGFSKTALSTALTAGGVEYVHLRALGNPKDNRAGFAETTTSGGREARERFADEVLSTEGAREALETIEELQGRGSVMLLCFESEERCCHRSLVLEALRARADREQSELVLA